MSYLNMLFCAPNSLKSQETNFIYNHLQSHGGQTGADRRERCLKQRYFLRGLREGVQRRHGFGKKAWGQVSSWLKCCDVFGESSEGDLLNRLEKRVEMVNADAEGNADIPGPARFPVIEIGIFSPEHPDYCSRD